MPTPHQLRRAIREPRLALHVLYARIVPSRLRIRLEHAAFTRRLLANTAYDARRYLRFSGGTERWGRRQRLEARITMNYHRIEKGLALSDPRPRFGTWAIRELLGDLDAYLRTYGADELTGIALSTLDAYLDHHRRIDDLDRDLEQHVAELRSRHEREASAVGGVQEVDRETILAAAQRDLDEFFARRHSIRHFSPEPVDMADLERAVRMAQKAPSVCNRQTARVHAFSDPVRKQEVLAHQNGNRGFGEQIGVVLVVTAELGRFVSVGERNQAWIDGGMFAVSLIWALHSLGLGTCALNCSNEKEHDAALREAAGVPEDEAIITMIAVGRLPERFRVAQSPRRPLHEVLVAHDGAPAGDRPPAVST